MANDCNIDGGDINYEDNVDSNNLVLSGLSGDLTNTGRTDCVISETSNRQDSSSTLEGTAVRQINPAIYVESLESNNHELSQTQSQDVITGLSNIRINSDYYPSAATYRAVSMSSSRRSRSISSAATKTKSLGTIEKRCKFDDKLCDDVDYPEPEIRRYSVNGQKIVQISASLPDCTVEKLGSVTSLLQNSAYDDWMKKKKSELLSRKQEEEKLLVKRKLAVKKSLREREEKDHIERENFAKWLENKRAEDERKRMLAEEQLNLERQLSELEDHTHIVKEVYLKYWHYKKDREWREKKRIKNQKVKEIEDELKRRREKSSEAFELWSEKAKKRPCPATQGLLPHQQSQPAYFNPIPWVADDICTADDYTVLTNQS